MELECTKYKEKMTSDEAACRHPGDYCQFRSSCMIQFLEKENRAAGREKEAAEEGHEDNADT